jgi:hypothetical protein
MTLLRRQESSNDHLGQFFSFERAAQVVVIVYFFINGGRKSFFFL